MNRDNTATALSKDNRIKNAILDEDDDTDNNDEMALFKSHCNPHIQTPDSRSQKMRMTVSLDKDCDKTSISNRAATIVA